MKAFGFKKIAILLSITAMILLGTAIFTSAEDGASITLGSKNVSYSSAVRIAVEVKYSGIDGEAGILVYDSEGRESLVGFDPTTETPIYESFELITGNDRSFFLTQGIPARKMSCDYIIVPVVRNDDGLNYGIAEIYSVTKYAEQRLTEDPTELQASLYNDILAYAEAAEAMRNTDGQVIAASYTSAMLMKVNQLKATSGEQGIRIAGQNLAYEGAVQILYMVETKTALSEGESIKILYSETDITIPVVGDKLLASEGVYVKSNPTNSEGAPLTVTVGGKEYYALFSEEIMPKHLSKDTYACPVIVDADGTVVSVGKVKEYSPYTYVINRLESKNFTEKQKSLYLALLNYGASVQEVLEEAGKFDIAECDGVYADAYCVVRSNYLVNGETVRVSEVGYREGEVVNLEAPLVYNNQNFVGFVEGSQGDYADYRHYTVKATPGVTTLTAQYKMPVSATPLVGTTKDTFTNLNNVSGTSTIEDADANGDGINDSVKVTKPSTDAAVVTMKPSVSRGDYFVLDYDVSFESITGYIQMNVLFDEITAFVRLQFQKSGENLTFGVTKAQSQKVSTVTYDGTKWTVGEATGAHKATGLYQINWKQIKNVRVVIVPELVTKTYTYTDSVAGTSETRSYTAYAPVTTVYVNGIERFSFDSYNETWSVVADETSEYGYRITSTFDKAVRAGTLSLATADGKSSTAGRVGGISSSRFVMYVNDMYLIAKDFVEVDPAATVPFTQESRVESNEYDAYPAFNEIADPTYLVPGLNQGFIPQSMDEWAAEGVLFVGGYFRNQKVSPSSAILAVDTETGEFVGQYLLKDVDGSYITGHFGGLAVTEKNIFVVTDGYLYRIPLAQVSAGGSAATLIAVEKIKVPGSGFANYSDGILWVGRFYHPDVDDYHSPDWMHLTNRDGVEYGNMAFGYRLEKTDSEISWDPNATAYATPDVILSITDRIQGFTLAGDKIVLSQSYGRTSNSSMLIYDNVLDTDSHTSVTVNGEEIPVWFLDSENFVASYTAPPMSEGICYEGDTLYISFESGAPYYMDDGAKNPTDRIWTMTIE